MQEKTVTILGDFRFTGAPHWTGMVEAFENLGWLVNKVEGGENIDAPPADLTIIGSHSWFLRQPQNRTCYWLCDPVKRELPSEVVFTNNAEKGIYLPQASVVRKTIVRDKPNDDIVFIGTPTSEQERIRMIELIKPRIYYHENVENARIEIYASTPEIYGNAAVCLGIDSMRNENAEFSNRIWNTIGCGGFYLTLYSKGLERFFENKKHLVWADSLEEMKELADYYVKHQDEARKIAEEGFKLVQAEHTYNQRIKQMLTCLGFQ